MPHWRRDFRNQMREATTWVTMGEIANEARRRHGGQARPSIPCIKNWLIEQIRRRNVIGMLGARGSAYFAQVDNLQNNTQWRGGSQPPMPRSASGSSRRSIRQFNQSVQDALRSDSDIPLPFNRNGRGIPQQSGEVPSGPIRAEPIEPISGFASTDTTRFSREIREFLETIRRASGVNLSDYVDRQARGYISMEDLGELAQEMGRRLGERAREKSRNNPASLEEEFYRRMEEKERAEAEAEAQE